MPVAVTHWLYKFEELSDRAKEKARSWYREGQLDYDWWDFIYEDAMRMAEILGIEVDFRYHGPRSPGKKGYKEPKIWFSGFSHQGSGACWEGSYRYAKGALKKLQSEAPARYQYFKPDGTMEWTENKGNIELHRIAKALQKVQDRHFYKLVATSTHRGHYNHSGCMSIEVEHDEAPYRDLGDAEDDIKDALRDFADWIYRRLEEEHDWLTSDEQVDESIIANEYTFDEEGNRE
jgi:hypothetical protein